MENQTIEYFDANQKLIGELIYDNKNQSLKPAIIVFHAIEGRGDFTVNYAKKIAEKGYAVFVADMYGDAEVATNMEEGFKLITPFLQDRQLVRRRAKLAYQTLLQQKMVDQNKIGAIGFCFGGMCLLELARSGENLSAGVAMHSVLAKSNLPTEIIKSKLLVLHGFQDPQVPPSALQVFADEMREAQVHDWTFTFFGDAKHSFTDPKTGTFDAKKEKEMGREYNSVAAERSFQYALNFFAEHLQ